jgi:hypothetical protein
MPKSSLLLATLASLLPAPAAAQSLASPFSTVSQTVDSTTITVEYYRPSTRGRRIFGGLIHWEELWTPGANWATTLEVNRPVRLQGNALPAGKYSLWFIPARPPEPWTIVVNRAARRFHVQPAEARDDQLRFTVAPDSGPEQELLTFSFPAVNRERATLAFHWARTGVNLHFEITASSPRIAAAHPWASYAGSYALRFAHDSAGPPVFLEITERNDALWVRAGVGLAEAGLDTEFDLLPAGGDDFHPRQYKNGKLIGDNLDELISFHLENGRATGFEIHGLAEGVVLVRASRVER